MSLLCKCVRLDLISEVITDTGGAEGTWDAPDGQHAAYTVALLAGPECGGILTSQESRLELKMNGCGRLRVSATGPASAYTSFPDVIVYRSAPTGALFLQLYGSGGYHTGCAIGDLLLFSGANPAEFSVCCGQHIVMQVINLDNTHTPALIIELAVEVIG